MRTVVLVPRPRPGELQVMVLAVPEQLGVDKFRAVIAVNPAYRERQVLHHAPYRGEDVHLRLVAHALVLSPPSGDIGHRQREAELPTGVASLVSHQVDLHKARGVLVMISPRPHRDPGLQQRPRLGMRPALEDEFGPCLLYTS